MYICICYAVTENEIRQAVSLGAHRLEQLKDALGVACDCRTCEYSINEILTEMGHLPDTVVLS